MFAVEKTLLPGRRQAGRQVAGIEAGIPARQLGAEQLRGADGGTQVARLASTGRVAHWPVDPGVGHITAHDGNRGVFRPNCVREIRHPTDTDAHAREFPFGFLEQLADFPRAGRAGVVARVNEGQPGLIGPIRGRREAAAIVPGGIHREQARPIRPLPPKKQRQPG